MPVYEIIESHKVLYKYRVEAKDEEEAKELVYNGDADSDFLDAFGYEIESVELVED